MRMIVSAVVTTSNGAADDDAQLDQWIAKPCPEVQRRDRDRTTDEHDHGQVDVLLLERGRGDLGHGARGQALQARRQRGRGADRLAVEGRHAGFPALVVHRHGPSVATSRASAARCPRGQVWLAGRPPRRRKLGTSRSSLSAFVDRAWTWSLVPGHRRSEAGCVASGRRRPLAAASSPSEPHVSGLPSLDSGDGGTGARAAAGGAPRPSRLRGLPEPGRPTSRSAPASRARGDQRDKDIALERVAEARPEDHVGVGIGPSRITSAAWRTSLSRRSGGPETLKRIPRAPSMLASSSGLAMA